jgi:hypothetical protein
MPVPPDESSTLITDATRGRAVRTDGSVGLILDYLDVGRFDRSSRGVRIAVRLADGDTLCEVRGVLDASSAAHLAEAVDVALNLEPRNTVLLDLTRVDWMALLDVRAVMDKARRAHPGRRIAVRYTEGRHRESALPTTPHHEADETRYASASWSGEDHNSGDLMPVAAVR